MRAGDEITVTPTELVAGGAAIARVDGFPIFATNVFWPRMNGWKGWSRLMNASRVR